MIDELKARIGQAVPEIKFVGEAADFQSAVESHPKVTPSLFVVPQEEDAQPCAVASITMQKVRASLGLVFVVKNLTDNKGVAARGDLDVLRKKVKEAVYGWAPSPDFEPLERGPSHLMAFRDGHVWWQDIYITSYYDRSIL